MTRSIQKERLSQAKEFVALGERHIAELHKRIAEAQRNGLDVSNSLALLKTFEETQALHIADQARLEKELSENSI